MAYNTLHLTKVAVVDDGKAYGQGVTQNFTAKFTALGGKVVLRQQISDASIDYSAVVDDIKTSGAQAVVYGGEYPQAAPLTKQLKEAGVTVPLLAADAVVTAGAPIGATAAQQKFISEYKAAGYTEPYGIFGPYAYDATMAIIHVWAFVVLIVVLLFRPQGLLGRRAGDRA